jgi:hypothetical protein
MGTVLEQNPPRSSLTPRSFLFVIQAERVQCTLSLALLLHFSKELAPLREEGESPVIILYLIRSRWLKIEPT